MFLAASIGFYLAWSGLGNQFVWGESMRMTQHAWGLMGCFIAYTALPFNTISEYTGVGSEIEAFL